MVQSQCLLLSVGSWPPVPQFYKSHLLPGPGQAYWPHLPHPHGSPGKVQLTKGAVTGKPRHVLGDSEAGPPCSYPALADSCQEAEGPRRGMGLLLSGSQRGERTLF